MMRNSPPLLETWRGFCAESFKPFLHPHDGELTPWEVAFRKEFVGMSLSDKLTLALTLRFRLELRNAMAEQTLAGVGLEIGAQQVPTTVDYRKARVEYVDRLTADETANRFAIPRDALVEVTHVCDAAKLDSIPDESKDFLIANHVLEHFDDPIGGLAEWLRVLKTCGRLFISLPNRMGNAFDFRRTPPTLSHLKRDFRDRSYRELHNRFHYADMVRTIYGFDESNPLILATADEWIRKEERHHYHVYDVRTLYNILREAAHVMDVSLTTIKQLSFAFGYEFLIVVEKGAVGTKGFHAGNSFAHKISEAALVFQMMARELRRSRDRNDA
jgi:SAM-dependent methyltransferase